MDKSQLRILLADDDEDDCLMFKDVLDELPLATHLTTVHNGEELMSLLTGHTQPLPEVLFLDLNMPRLSGFECLLEIKNNPKLNHLPVIILSTFIDTHLKELLYTHGAHYCVRKPADFTQLKKVVLLALTLTAQANGLQPAKSDFVLHGD